MQIEPVTAPVPANLGSVERAHAALNAAYNALAVDSGVPSLGSDTELAKRYVREAHTELAGHDGPSDAGLAARAVLPRLEHALALLDALGTSHDVTHVAPLLDELGLAMDRVEATLAGAGWE